MSLLWEWILSRKMAGNSRLACSSTATGTVDQSSWASENPRTRRSVFLSLCLVNRNSLNVLCSELKGQQRLHARHRPTSEPKIRPERISYNYDPIVTCTMLELGYWRRAEATSLKAALVWWCHWLWSSLTNRVQQQLDLLAYTPTWKKECIACHISFIFNISNKMPCPSCSFKKKMHCLPPDRRNIRHQIIPSQTARSS